MIEKVKPSTGPYVSECEFVRPCNKSWAIAQCLVPHDDDLDAGFAARTFSERMCANARLLAASWDLLAALTELMRAVSAYRASQRHGGPVVVLGHELDVAMTRAALIAKKLEQ